MGCIADHRAAGDQLLVARCKRYVEIGEHYADHQAPEEIRDHLDRLEAEQAQRGGPPVPIGSLVAPALSNAVLDSLLAGCRGQAKERRCSPFELGPGYAIMLANRYEGAARLVAMADDLGVVAAPHGRDVIVAGAGRDRLLVPSSRFGRWLATEALLRFGELPSAADTERAMDAIRDRAVEAVECAA